MRNGIRDQSFLSGGCFPPAMFDHHSLKQLQHRFSLLALLSLAVGNLFLLFPPWRG
jgi:hypothetical protein